MQSRWWVLGLACTLVSAGWSDEALKIDVEARARVESRNDRDFNGAADDDRTNVLTRVRLGATYRADDHWTLRLQAQDSEAWDPIFSTPAYEAKVEIQELYAHYQNSPLEVQFGRLPLSYGRQRLVGTFEWSNVARRFDGFKVGYDFGPAKLDGWFTTLGSSPSTFNADGEFWGLYNTWPRSLGGRTEAYLFWNHQLNAALTNFWTIGGRHEAKVGPWRYEVELAGQIGDVSAWAATLEGGRSLGPVDLTLGFAAASGDSDPTNGRTTTFQNLFPTNHGFYGTMDYQSWQNVQNLYGKASWKPHRNLQIQGEAHAFWLANRRDFWYGAGGAPNRTTGGVAYRDATGASGNVVGQELDLNVSWQAVRQLSLQAGFGHFFRGRFINAVNQANGLTGRDSNWFYFQALGSF